MLETFFKHFATNLRNFPKISEDIRRHPKISDDFRRMHKKFKMLEGRLEHFATFSDFFRRYPKTSEDFRRFPKTSEDFRRFSKISETCLFLHSAAYFLKLSKEFPNIQQRRHEPLLPVTDRPLIFSCMLLKSNHTTFLVQFEINLHS